MSNKRALPSPAPEEVTRLQRTAAAAQTRLSHHQTVQDQDIQRGKKTVDILRSLVADDFLAAAAMDAARKKDTAAAMRLDRLNSLLEENIELQLAIDTLQRYSDGDGNRRTRDSARASPMPAGASGVDHDSDARPECAALHEMLVGARLTYAAAKQTKEEEESTIAQMSSSHVLKPCELSAATRSFLFSNESLQREASKLEEEVRQLTVTIENEKTRVRASCLCECASAGPSTNDRVPVELSDMLRFYGVHGLPSTAEQWRAWVCALDLASSGLLDTDDISDPHTERRFSMIRAGAQRECFSELQRLLHETHRMLLPQGAS